MLACLPPKRAARFSLAVSGYGTRGQEGAPAQGAPRQRALRHHERMLLQNFRDTPTPKKACGANSGRGKGSEGEVRRKAGKTSAPACFRNGWSVLAPREDASHRAGCARLGQDALWKVHIPENGQEDCSRHRILLRSTWSATSPCLESVNGGAVEGNAPGRTYWTRRIDLAMLSSLGEYPLGEGCGGRVMSLATFSFS